MSQIVCPQCGKAYDESLTACPECGAAQVPIEVVEPMAEEPVAAPAEVAVETPKTAKRSGGPGWWWWLITVVLLALAVGGTYLLTKRHVLEHLPELEPIHEVDTVVVSVESGLGHMTGSIQVLKIGYPNSDDGFVNVRTSPHADAEVVAKMTGVELMGNAVILESKGAWDVVRCEGKTGYAYSKYITYQSWYTGKGDRRLVAATTTPIYFSSQKDDMTHGAQMATVEAGTIIGDKFDSAGADSYVIVERGQYYYLANGMQGYYIPKRTVTMESCL